MNCKLYFAIFFFICTTLYSQVKISGIVLDTSGDPIPYASVVLENSTIGVVTDETGKFYIESKKKYSSIIVSFLGFETKKIQLKRPILYNLKIALKESPSGLKEIVVYSGKQKKKGNPAIDILRKVISKKRKNGIYLYKQYEYDKYEKIQFDINNIDSSLTKSKLFKGMEFISNYIDTSRVTGKSYLPIFINEAVYKSYGTNEPTSKYREDLQANKTSGFKGNQTVISYVKDLYVDYNIYDSYIKIFNKSFVSPISKRGIIAYNYVLSDSAFIGKKWCYNIVYYPRRKGTLTFKGDFWVNDTTFAVKEINMSVSKSANINWIKDLYIEQEYEVLNDSIFLLRRDHIMTNFGLSKKEEAKGIYGKRTSLFDNYTFDTKREPFFYDIEIDIYNTDIYNRPDSYWEKNRQEELNKNELGIYSMLDKLITIPTFKRIYDISVILASGYIEFNNFDYGPIFSTFGKNDVEGSRFRVGGRTYFGPNDLWRLQGYTAYGSKDKKFKYGISWKWMFNKKNRCIIEIGNRRDVEQTGVSLTTSDDVLGRSFASSAFFASGDSGKLTNINLSTFSLTTNLKKNLEFQIKNSYKTLKSASSVFSLNYLDQNGVEQSKTKQSEITFSLKFTPNRKTIGNGVEQKNVNNKFPTLYMSYSRGLKGFLGSDFSYQKTQLYYNQPLQIGGLGRSKITVELGKTFGKVPLNFLNVIPGNQSYFIIDNTFGLLNYYEFVTDTYMSLKFKHNFNGSILNLIPVIKKLNLREIINVKGAWGNISKENKDINRSSIVYTAPDDIYVEYSAGIGNIFKIFNIDFIWRANYLDIPDSNNFGIKGGFGFTF